MSAAGRGMYSDRSMLNSPPAIEVGDRVTHLGREGYVHAVYPSGICWVDFIHIEGGVSAPMSELRLVEKRRPDESPEAGRPSTNE